MTAETKNYQTINKGDVDQTSSEICTVEQVIDDIGFGRFQIKLFLICGLQYAADAMEMMLLSLMSPEWRCEWRLQDWQVAFITSIIFTGQFAGAFIWGNIADRYGRLSVYMLGAIWICYFGFLTAFSPNFYWIVALRMCVGVGFGGAIQAMVLLNEFFPSHLRAKATIVMRVMWCFGSIFITLISSGIIPTGGWRIVVMVIALPILLSVLSLWTLPESCRYLLAKGRRPEAIKILTKMAEMNGRPVPTGQLEASQTSQGQLTELFCTKEMYRTTLQLWLMWIGSSFSYYGTALLISDVLEKNSLHTVVDSDISQTCSVCRHHSFADYMSMTIIALCELIDPALNIMLISYMGRRTTLTLNFAFVALFNALLTLSGGSIVLLTLFACGVRAFSAGTSSLLYVYTTEFYPTTIRSTAVGSCSSISRIGGMMTPFIAQVLSGHSVWVALVVYACLAGICAVCGLLLPVETKQRPMQQTTSAKGENEKMK